MEVVSRHFSTIESTNSWAKQYLHEFDAQKVMIISADEQTAGRGQFNRRWFSPPNQNIYVTYCFFMEPGRSDIIYLPQILALSVIKVLEEQDYRVRMKWPNDLMISGKKVGGILCETTPFNNQLAVIIGLGLNVNMNQEVLKNIDQPATSLAHEKGILIKKDELLSVLNDAFVVNLSIYLKNGFQPFKESVDDYLIKEKDS